MESNQKMIKLQFYGLYDHPGNSKKKALRTEGNSPTVIARFLESSAPEGFKLSSIYERLDGAVEYRAGRKLSVKEVSEYLIDTEDAGPASATDTDPMPNFGASAKEFFSQSDSNNKESNGIVVGMMAIFTAIVIAVLIVANISQNWRGIYYYVSARDGVTAISSGFVYGLWLVVAAISLYGLARILLHFKK